MKICPICKFDYNPNHYPICPICNYEEKENK